MTFRLTFLAVLIAVAPVAAQDACADAVQQIVAQSNVGVALPRPDGSGSCGQLATVISNRLSRLRAVQAGPYALQLAPRDVQPAQGATGGDAGSAAQSEAVPDARPAALAGGALSAVGTGEGTGAIASISVNPAAFLVGDDPEAVARLSRLLDVSLLLPADGSDRDADGRIDYLGARVRINALGPASGDSLYRSLNAVFSRVLAAETSEWVRLRRLLAGAPDTVACALTLVAPVVTEDRVLEVCGAPFEFVPAALYAEFQREVARVRRAADRQYFGLDARLDVGDPTLSGVPEAWGWSLSGALAFGRRFGDGIGSPELRLRAGALVVDREAYADGTRVAFDGALGLAFDRPYGLQQLSGALGIEARYGSHPADTSAEAAVSALDDDYVRVRGSLNVPLGPVYSASVSLAVPVVGDAGGPILSVGGNWQLLWPGTSR